MEKLPSKYRPSETDYDRIQKIADSLMPQLVAGAKEIEKDKGFNFYGYDQKDSME